MTIPSRVRYSRRRLYSTVLVRVLVETARLEYRTRTLDGTLKLTLTWMPWIKFLSGRTCILLWILYGDMVDFSFIVSLYVSDLFNVTITVRVAHTAVAVRVHAIG